MLKRFSLFGTAWVVAMLPASGSAQEGNARADAKPSAQAPASSDTSTRGIPSWATDAKWYQVAVPRFHNGDSSNDPPGTTAWATGWPWKSDGSSPVVAPPSPKPVGGDFAGVQKRLTYLSELGVNTLCLTDVFQTDPANPAGGVDLRHVDDSLGVGDSLTKLKDETADPSTWEFSESDRAFLKVVRSAHEAGFRVVVAFEADRGLDGGFLTHVARRWMDPDGDKDPSDGIDGWWVREPGTRPSEFWKEWRKRVKAINPQALLVCDVDVDPAPWLKGSQFDVAVDRGAARELARFFVNPDRPNGLSEFTKAITDIGTGGANSDNLATPQPLDPGTTGRLLSALKQPRTGAEKTESEAPATVGAHAVDRWRLAAAVLSFLPGAPVFLYGDEVGMHALRGESTQAAMWWPDLPQPANKPGVFRDDFASLVQWLNVRRDIHAPLKTGTLGVVLKDPDRRVFALKRSLPEDETILVVNYGPSDQRVSLPAGVPGQMVGVLSPKFEQPKRRIPRAPEKAPPRPEKTGLITPLHLGASRQYVDPGGKIVVWVDAMSVRLVIVRAGLR